MFGMKVWIFLEMICHLKDDSFGRALILVSKKETSHYFPFVLCLDDQETLENKMSFHVILFSTSNLLFFDLFVDGQNVSVTI